MPLFTYTPVSETDPERTLMPDAEKKLRPEQEEALAEARERAAAEKKDEPAPPQDKTAEVVKLPTSGNARLVVDPGQQWWTEAQRAALAAAGLDSVPDGDLVAFLHLCQRSGLDPFAREVYLIGRKDKDAPSGKKWTAQTGIDGYRHIAERTGQLIDTLGPYWCGTDGEWRDVWLLKEPPAAARVGIVREGHREPVWGTAIYNEFVPMKPVWKNNQRTSEEEPSGLWKKMPAHMIAKCAEALAIRRAFPRQAGGIYVAEEMAQADVVAEQKELEETGNARARQREELVQRPWGKPEPAKLDEVGVTVLEGDVIADGEPIPYDRDALEDELSEQAKLLGTTVVALARRWVAANRKNLDQATDAELHALVASRREEVRQALIAQMGAMPDEPTDEDPQGATPADASEAPAPTRGRRTRKADSAPQKPAQDEPVDAEVVCDDYKPWGDADDAPCLTCGQPKH